MANTQKKETRNGGAAAKKSQTKKVTIKDMSAAGRAAGEIRGGYLRSPRSGSTSPKGGLTAT